jgi:hypothetical protein
MAALSYTQTFRILANPQIPLEAPLLPGGHMLDWPLHKMEIQMLGPKIMLAFTSLKHHITELKEITDLNRMMGPPVNKISHYAHYLKATSYLP